ncbi:MAG: hypothetical protein RLZZ592_331 [Pseudomonadota bacterium]|jgi:CRP-like cAMP-binding protein
MSPPDRIDLRAGLALSAPESWFQTLPRPLQAELARRAQPRFLRAGERLFSRGDPPDGLYGVSEGMLRISGSHERSGDALLALVGAPHWFGEIGLFDGDVRAHDVHAETDALLVHLPQAVMLAVLEREPGVWLQVGRLLARKMRSMYVSFEQMQMLAPRERVARRLVMMAADYHVDQPTLRRELVVSQEQLARMLSLSRQTVNEVLAALEADGMIRRHRRRIELLDPDRLLQDGPVLLQEDRCVDKSVDNLLMD